jgi:septal ring factor EnvC (AmiA/AmiB activator)
MGKDGGGGDGGSYFSSTTTTPAKKTIHDVHIATLQVIENELQRLHHDLRVSAGDDDETQSQINNLHEELARLSEQLGDAEVELD